MDVLRSYTLPQLKKVCKFLHLRNYSSARKNEVITLIIKYLTALKIQKWTRRILSRGELCPISCEPIKYPCYPFKTGTNILIYYNLLDLRSFMIKTGDFRDPSTRKNYTQNDIIEIDRIYEYYTKIHNVKKNKKEYFETVYKAWYSGYKFYKKLDENEYQEKILEVILDGLCDSIIKKIHENRSKEERLRVLNTFILPEYEYNFELLMNRSEEHSCYVINKHIGNVFHVYEKETGCIDKNERELYDHVFGFLYLQEEIALELDSDSSSEYYSDMP